MSDDSAIWLPRHGPEGSPEGDRPLAINGGELTMEEVVHLGAVDSIFYSHYFFPRAARQGTPQYHRYMWEKLDGPSRKVSFMVFRGGAKTTLLRIFTSKRLAYQISKTVLYVGKSQDAAKRSVEWLMRAVEMNHRFRDTFAIRPGAKWAAEEIELIIGENGETARVVALGITGSTRGINIEDYRPDLIVIDDPSDEENTASPAQRTKTEDFILGSLYNSLAPVSENPLAKIAFLQTLLDAEDAISACDKDPTWDSARIPIFTPEGESQWPQRWTTEELIAEKQANIERGKLYLWMREMECQVIGAADAAFPRAKHQIKYYEVTPPPGSMVVALAVDPVPPPSDKELAEGLRRKDEEAWTAVGLWRDRQTGEKRIYVLDQRAMKGHTPDWSISTFISLRDLWRPIRLKAESVNYQRTLAWLLEKEMMRNGGWVPIDAFVPEKRKKTYRIIDTIGDALARGLLYFHKSQTELLAQIINYPSIPHDDRIESLAVAIACILEVGGVYEGDYEDVIEGEAAYPDLPDSRSCP